MASITTTAQTVLLCDSFEQYNVGLLDTQSVVWNSWDNAPEDTKVVNAQANSGTQSIRSYTTGPNSTSDIVAELGNLATGRYKVELSFLVTSISGGYFNLMHEYDTSLPTFGTWAVEIYLDGSTESGEIFWGTAAANVSLDTFAIKAGSWNDMYFIIDLDIDSAFLYVNDAFKTEWRWSYGNTGVYTKFDAIDLFSASPVGTTTSAWYDDICVTDITASPPVANSTCDDFESYSVGRLDTQTTQWESFGGGPEDGEIIDTYSNSGTQSLKINDSGPNSVADVIYDFGPKDSDVWSLQFSAYLGNNDGSYFNLMHEYDATLPTFGTWAIETFLYGDTEYGMMQWGSGAVGTIAEFSFNADTWNDFEIVVDLENDRAVLWVNGVIIRAWPWHLGQGGVYEELDAINFYSAAQTGSLSSNMYVDDFCMDTTTWYCPEDVSVDFTSSMTSSDGLEWLFDGTNSVSYMNRWDFGDGTVIFTTDKLVNHTYAAEGSYTVELTCYDRCSFADSLSETISAIGLEEFVSEFTVYPNPSDGAFHLRGEMASSNNLAIRVYDITGKTVYFDEIQNFSGNLNTELSLDLPNGTYVLELQHDRGRIHERIVIH